MGEVGAGFRRQASGFKNRKTDAPIIVAGIQSVYKKACELDRFDLILIDEAHQLPPDGEGMYQTFFRDAKVVNPNVRLIGLTATPYRLKSGMLCGPKNLLNEVCYEIGVKELIEQGFLCPLKSKSGRHKVDCDGLHVRAGEFVASEVDALMNTTDNVNAAARTIPRLYVSIIASVSTSIIPSGCAPNIPAGHAKNLRNGGRSGRTIPCPTVQSLLPGSAEWAALPTRKQLPCVKSAVNDLDELRGIRWTINRIPFPKISHTMKTMKNTIIRSVSKDSKTIPCLSDDSPSLSLRYYVLLHLAFLVGLAICSFRGCF